MKGWQLDYWFHIGINGSHDWYTVFNVLREDSLVLQKLSYYNYGNFLSNKEEMWEFKKHITKSERIL